LPEEARRRPFLDGGAFNSDRAETASLFAPDRLAGVSHAL
jgi:hypothetical protein